MNNLFLYFAYGSNMNPTRMAKRCPGAITLGRAKLPHYRLAERLYADIEFEEESELHGVLYCITENHLHKLDSYEGYPKVYRRIWLDVIFRGEIYQAVTYEMSTATKFIRAGVPFPDEYREICSEGAKYHHVKNYFIKRKVKK